MPHRKNRRLTFPDNEIRHHETDGVPGVNVVAAKRVLAVDGEPEPGEEANHPLEDEDGVRGVRLGGAVIVGVRDR